MKRSIGACVFALSILFEVSAAESQDQTIDHQSVYSRETNIHGIKLPREPFIDSLGALRQEAQMGDAQAAAQVFAALSFCKNPEARSDFPSYCQGLTEVDLDESGRWLTLATQLGDKDAQFRYAASPEEIFGRSNSDADAKASAEYKETARKYLLDLARECNLSAIGFIATSAAREQTLFGDEPAIGYEYLRVLRLLKPHSTLLDKDQSILEQRMRSESERANAQRNARNFVTQYCQ